MAKFNFPYDFKTRPTHRVDFYWPDGFSVSSPAIFKDTEEAVAAAKEEYESRWKEYGRVTIRIEKYSGRCGRGSLKMVAMFTL